MEPAPAGRARPARALLTYLLLVGIPGVGLLGILRVGRALTPPPAIGGEWTVRVAPPASLPAACAALLRPAAQPALTVSQSGLHLSLSLRAGEGESTLGGRMGGDSVHAEAAPRARLATPAAPCDASDGVRLDAALDARPGHPARMSGTLSIPGCPECAPAPFTAERVPPAPKNAKGGH